jgi:hypothetical protein
MCPRCDHVAAKFLEGFGDHGYMPAATARRLASALIDAADELDRLNS